jgi:hypothetical protein
MILIGVIVFVRSVGLAKMADAAVTSGSTPRVARLRRAFFAALWCGPALVMAGEAASESWLSVIGVIVWISAVPLLVARTWGLARLRRRRREL